MLHNVTKQPEKSTEEVMKGTDVETAQGLANSVFNKQQHSLLFKGEKWSSAAFRVSTGTRKAWILLCSDAAL